MSSVRKISAGTGANLVNLGYQIVITALTIPILLKTWGVEGYGIWVILTAIPTYLALSDFGFATAATNTMAMQFACGNRSKVDEVFQSVWVLNLLVGVAIIALAGAATFLMLHFDWHRQLAWPVFLLSLYSATSLVSRVVLGAYRGCGHYTRGTLLYDGMQFLEGAAMLGVAFLGGGYSGAALTLFFL